MRCPTERATRVALTLLVVVFMVYLGTYGTQDPVAHTQMLTLSLAGQDTGVRVQGNETPSSPTPKSVPRPYTVIKNKVYYLDQLPPVSTPLSADVQEGAALKPSAAAALRRIDYSLYKPKEREYLEARVEVLVGRARQVQEACTNPPKPRLRFPHLVWDQDHHVIWCPNYKVASTTWMINFLKLAHFNDDNPAIPTNLPPEKREELKFSTRFGAKHYEVFKLYPTPTSLSVKLSALQISARVIIVRHPFTRVLSAYRDKIIKARPLPAKFKFKEIQKTIIRKYRPPDSTENSPFPTFPEFVQYVIDFTATFTTAEDWRKNVKCWVPFWAQCNVCTMDYNVIMKLETMTEDERFLITLANMNEIKKTVGEWRHLRNVSSTQAAPDFYRKLTTRQMLDLHQRYKFDFDLFGYTLDAYLPLAKDAAPS